MQDEETMAIRSFLPPYTTQNLKLFRGNFDLIFPKENHLKSSILEYASIVLMNTRFIGYKQTIHEEFLDLEQNFELTMETMFVETLYTSLPFLHGTIS